VAGGGQGLRGLWKGDSEVGEFAPAGLESRDGVELIEVNGAIAGEAAVWAGGFVGLGADEQESVGAVGVDFEEDFVVGAEDVGGAGVGEVEAMEIGGGGLAIVEDGLIGQGDLRDVA